MIAAAGPARAIIIRAEDPARHARFVAGTYPANPQANPTWYVDEYDWSGVGWDTQLARRSVALISHRAFVGANHFRISPGGTVRFSAPDSSLHDYTVTSNFPILDGEGRATDLYVGILDGPVDPSIRRYPVRDYTVESELLGSELLAYGRGAAVGKGVLQAVTVFPPASVDPDLSISQGETVASIFTYLVAAGSPDDARLEGGDSGSPSFVDVNGQLVLVGSHSAIANVLNGNDQLIAVTNVDTLVPAYIDEINAVLSPYGESVSTLNPLLLPTPATFTLMLGAVGLSQRRRDEQVRAKKFDVS